MQVHNSHLYTRTRHVCLCGRLSGVWNRNFLGHQTCAVLPYSQMLVRFTAHLQQLDMESNGKHIDTSGTCLATARCMLPCEMVMCLLSGVHV